MSDEATTASTPVNTTPSWSSIFHGILLQPTVTLRELDALCDTSALPQLTTQAFNTVFLTAVLLGFVRFSTDDYFISIFELLNVMTNEMFFWVLASAVLSVLSGTLANARKTRWKKALVMTGWSLTPIIFFAPMLCLKNALGAWILPFATIPTWWTLFLLCASFKIALGVSARKLLLIAMVLPPMLFLVYIFWTGLSLFVLLSEVISAFQH